MVDPVLRQPTLVALCRPGDRPRLRARQCVCGRIFFPPQLYGCEQCGREGAAAHEITIDACGVVTALAMVHQHPKLRVPFVLGRVALDAGISVDVRLVSKHRDPQLGSRVRGALVPDVPSESSAVVLDLCFELEQEPT